MKRYVLLLITLSAMMWATSAMSAPGSQHKNDGCARCAHAFVKELNAAVVVGNGYAAVGQLEALDGCETADSIFCIDPNTPLEQRQALLDRLPKRRNQREGFFTWASRWEHTVMNGPTGGNGSPIILTYSFVPDGTMIYGNIIGEPDGPSNLQSWLNFQFFTVFPDVWKDKFRAAFARWSQLIGVTYIEVSDDGAPMGLNETGQELSPGVSGVRGDVRIGGHLIDAPGGIFAYNGWPEQGGDMVLDSGNDYFANPANDYRFLRNLVMHEHGHGLGLGHVTPNNGTKLMESLAHTGVDGPQDDDIRGGQFLYGDKREKDDTLPTATPLGTPTFFYDFNLSTSLAGDEDWFVIEVPHHKILTVTAVPVGGEYEVGDGDNGTPYLIDTRRVNQLAIDVFRQDGGTYLATNTAPGYGEPAILDQVDVWDNGFNTRCYIRIRNGGSFLEGTPQRYALFIQLVDPLTTLYVDKNYVGTEWGTPQNPYRTIQAALNAATAQTHTIYIKAANYNERPRITKKLRLLNWLNNAPARIGRP